MGIANYLELKTAIQNYAKRDDLLSVIDDFIDLTEADLWQNLRVKEMLVRATASTGSDRYLALPDGYIEMLRLDYASGGDTYNLTQVSPESMKMISGSGMPSTFTVDSQIVFDRVPGSYTMQMHYYAKATALSASNATNAILTNYPTVYLYGSLFHFAQWSLNDQMLMKYSQLFDEAIARANKNTKKGRHGPAPAMRTENSTP